MLARLCALWLGAFAAGVGCQTANGYALSGRLCPDSREQGSNGWFYAVEDAKGFHLMKPEGTGGDPRWISEGGGASISENAKREIKLRASKAARPVCRWVSTGEGDVYLSYSAIVIPRGITVRMTVSGKDAIFLDNRPPAPGNLHQSNNFHREVLRTSSWFGIRVHKGSILDFSFDYTPAPDASPEPESCEIAMRLEVFAMDDAAFGARTFRLARPAPRSQAELEQAAQLTAADLRLLAHKTFRGLAQFPEDFSTRQGANGWSYGFDDGNGFQPMTPLENPAGFQWVSQGSQGGAAITSRRLTAVGNARPVLRWASPVEGQMLVGCRFDDQSLGAYIAIHSVKDRGIPYSAKRWGSSGGCESGQSAMGQGDSFEFGFEVGKADKSQKVGASKPPGKVVETGVEITVLQRLEQDPPPPVPSGYPMAY